MQTKQYFVVTEEVHTVTLNGTATEEIILKSHAP